MRIQRTTRLVCVQRATHRHAQPPPRGAEPSLRRCIHAVLRTSVPSLLPDCNSLRKQVAILTNCTVRSAAKHKNPHNSGPFKSALTAHPASSAAVRSKSDRYSTSNRNYTYEKEGAINAFAVHVRFQSTDFVATSSTPGPTSVSVNCGRNSLKKIHVLIIITRPPHQHAASPPRISLLPRTHH
jgi:hypothetical protein